MIKQGYEQIEFGNFEEDLYNVRYELSKSRIMDTSLPELEELIINKCKTISADGQKIGMRELRTIMSDCKQLALTAFQMSVLLGYSEPDENAEVDFRKFAPVFVSKIEDYYSTDALRRKS